MDLLEFFTPEAGQRRRAWLDDQDRKLSGAARHYLGPTGIPDRAGAVAYLASLLSPGADVQDAYTASGDLVDAETPLDAAAAGAGLTAALAGLFMPGNLSTARQGFTDLVDAGVATHKSGVVNMFAGPRAQTADLDALARAKDLAASGAGRDEIWNATGWFQGADGAWRFEIDDRQARYVGPDTSAEDFAYPRGLEMHRGTLTKGLDHPDLFAAYPQLKDVEFQTAELAGPNAKFTTMGPRIYDSAITMGKHVKDPRSKMLHETQHAVQMIEGFKGGANLNDPLTPGTPGGEVLREHLEALDRPPPTYDEFLKASNGDRGPFTRSFYEKSVLPAYGRSDRNLRSAKEGARTEVYRRNAGEVEARNVEARRDMTPDERRAKAPWETQDTPTERQILPPPPSHQWKVPRRPWER